MNSGESSIKLFGREKKSCELCAYHQNPTVLSASTWGRKTQRHCIQQLELGSKQCKKIFLRRKEDMTFDQLLAERENNKLSNRLKRNWKFIVELAGFIGVIVAVVELYLLLIHW